MKTTLLCSLALSVFLLAGPAMADLVAPGPCEFVTVGSACTTSNNVPGTCQCTAAQNVQGACYSCPTSASPADGCMVCQPGSDSSGCDISKGSTAKYVAPWAMAGAFSLLVLFGRRRRSR